MLCEPGLTGCHKGLASLWVKMGKEKSRLPMSVAIVDFHSQGFCFVFLGVSGGWSLLQRNFAKG